MVAVVDARGAFDDGLAAVRALADAVEINAASLLVLISRTDVDHLDALVQAGATHYLASPFKDSELLQSLDVAMAALRHGRTDRARQHCDRCQTILIGLGASLDHDLGGDIAQSLARIYRSMGSELRKIVASHDIAKLQNLREGVASLADSWAKLV